MERDSPAWGESICLWQWQPCSIPPMPAIMLLESESRQAQREPPNQQRAGRTVRSQRRSTVGDVSDRAGVPPTPLAAGPLDTKSRDPGNPRLLHFGTGATLPATLHLAIEPGIKTLIEAFGRPGTIREHDLCKLLALLGHGSDKGWQAVFYSSRSFDSAVQVYGPLAWMGGLQSIREHTEILPECGPVT